MKSKIVSRLYGFEDYRIVKLSDTHLFCSYNAILPSDFDYSALTFMTVDASLPVRVEEAHYGSHSGVRFTPNLYENHPKLLDTANKVYTHQSCKLSRSMMAVKYKKSLNPWLSDAVVVPVPSGDDCNLYDVALFANDDAKLIVLVTLNDALSIAQAGIFKVGKRFGVLCKSIPNNNSFDMSYTRDQVLASEFFFAGKVLTIPNNQPHILDVLTRKLPVTKTVFEQTVQKSLSSKDNQLSLDILNNIYDMLKSSDDETVGAGLKALSMMDYMHYPNSVRYIIKNLDRYNYYYNKAANSTSVRFMRKQLSGSGKGIMWLGSYDMEIYEQDYELLKQLILHYNPHYKDNLLSRMKNFPFMKVSNDGILIPRLKQ